MNSNPLSSSALISRSQLSPSITAVRMMPYDGYGYGKSMNWHYVAANKADKYNEKCPHFDKDKPNFDVDRILITMSPIEDGNGEKIKFKVTCAGCNKQFPITSEK